MDVLLDHIAVSMLKLLNLITRLWLPKRMFLFFFFFFIEGCSCS